MTSFELYLKRNAKKFDTYLATFFNDGTHSDMRRYLYAPVAQLSGNAGKRHRPLICLLACEAVGGDPEKAWPSAAAIEHFHTAALIHDDIEDSSLTRRDEPCMHIVKGEDLPSTPATSRSADICRERGGYGRVKKKVRRVSIVMLTHDQLEYTQECLEALPEHDVELRTRDLDNASTDGTPEFLQQLQEQVERARAPQQDKRWVRRRLRTRVSLLRACGTIAYRTTTPSRWRDGWIACSRCYSRALELSARN